MALAAAPGQAPPSAGVSFLNRVATATKFAFQSVVGGTINTARVVLNPRDLLGPGPITKAVAKNLEATADTIHAAGSGIQSGFKWGVLIIILVAGLWAWSVIKPR